MSDPTKMSSEKGAPTEEHDPERAIDTTPSSISPPPEEAQTTKTTPTYTFPDGGLQAWSQVLVAHLVVFNTWGYINSFGIFQSYYVSLLDRPQADISWIGSVQVFLLFFIGTFSGRAADAGYFRHAFVAGSVFLLLGLFTTSACTQYWHFMLAQGLCMGLGFGLLFCSAVSQLATFFEKKRAIAVGIAATGTSTGGMVIAGLFEGLLPRIGFGWTIRVMGFLSLAFQVIGFALARTRLPPRKTGPLIEWSAFKELPYVLFTAGMFFSFWSIYQAYYFISEYASTVAGMTQSDSFNLVIVITGSGVVGRILPSWASDRYGGALTMMVPFVVLNAVCLYAWAAVYNEAGVWLFAIFYGMFSSAVNGLFPTALSRLTDDLSKIGVRTGMVFSVMSIAVLTGSPIGGALITGTHQRDYLRMQIFAATIMAGGAIFLILARIAKVGVSLKTKI